MANHRSAEKRHLQSLKRNAANRSNRSRLATQVKKARIEIAEKTGKNDQVLQAQSLLAKLARKGLIHKKAAQRRTSRLMKQLIAK